jgi:hypothetical protein
MNASELCEDHEQQLRQTKSFYFSGASSIISGKILVSANNDDPNDHYVERSIICVNSILSEIGNSMYTYKSNVR